MARLFSQTLLRQTIANHPTFTATTPANISVSLHHHRLFSKSSGVKGSLIEIELESSSTDTNNNTPNNNNNGVRKLEELIHRMVVFRSQPAWLPFLPGSSYWVPPIKTPANFGELLGRFANPLSREESMSLTTIRGWPSSSYFIDGTSGQLSCPIYVNVEDSSITSSEVEEQEPLNTDVSKESKSEEEK